VPATVSDGTQQDALEATFRKWVPKGGLFMDSRTFVKLLKDAKVVDKKYTPTNVDLLYTKLRRKNEKGLTIDLLHEALVEIAKAKKVPVDEIISLVTSAGSEGPTFKGTKPDDVRFHDDKSLYTGVHAHGGPSTTDVVGDGCFGHFESNLSTQQGQTVKLENLLDRSAATIRGLNQDPSSTAKSTQRKSVDICYYRGTYRQDKDAAAET